MKKEKSSWFSKDCRTGKKILVISNKGLSDTSKQELEHSGTLVTETTNTAANKKKEKYRQRHTQIHGDSIDKAM